MTDSIQAIAKAKLEQIVEQGTHRAGPVIDRVLNEIPTDRIARAGNLGFDVDHTGKLKVRMGDDVRDVHSHALGQMAERAGIPNKYVESLAVPGEANAWRRDLLATTLREHFGHDDSRYLVRSVGSQVRGFLSDRYRRLDSRPLLDAFVGACQSIGAIPYEGVANELRTSVRAILPRVVEPVPGEYLVFGLNWHNSDYGAGMYGVNAFALRLVCLNGMMGESKIKQIHLGKRLDDNLEYSARTYRLDTETMVSATRDVVRAVMGPAAVQRQIEAIQAAHSQEMSTAQAMRSVSKVLTKAEQGKVKDAFEGPDTLMLPAGQTAWRFSNALSWVANSTESADRKLELQSLAGKFAAA